MQKVLLLEDLEESQLVVKAALAGANLDLSIAGTVEEALKLIRAETFHLAILDLGLPDGKGFTVLDELRTEQHQNPPVFLLTSYEDLETKVMAFTMGADDYLIKPISPVELRARVEMRLKRSRTPVATTNTLRKGPLNIELALMRASVVDNETPRDLNLTAKEFKILAVLMQNEEKAYSRTDLVKLIWGDTVHVLERTIDSHIFGLRKKLGPLAAHIENISGKGYRFVSRPSADMPMKKRAAN